MNIEDQNVNPSSEVQALKTIINMQAPAGGPRINNCPACRSRWIIRRADNYYWCRKCGSLFNDDTQPE